MADQPKDRTEFLTAKQLAAHLQISEVTVHRLRKAGRIPAMMLSNKLIRFNLRDVKNALRGASQRPAQTPDESDQGPDPQLSFEDVYSDFSEEP